MSCRRTPKPRPSMQATTSTSIFLFFSAPSRIWARRRMRATLSRAVPSSPLIYASMITAGENSVGTKKSGA